MFERTALRWPRSCSSTVTPSSIAASRKTFRAERLARVARTDGCRRRSSSPTRPRSDADTRRVAEQSLEGCYAKRLLETARFLWMDGVTQSGCMNLVEWMFSGSRAS